MRRNRIGPIVDAPFNCRLSLERLESRVLLNADFRIGGGALLNAPDAPGSMESIVVAADEGELDSTAAVHTVRYDVVVVDRDGERLRELTVGEAFWIRVYVRDLRPETDVGGLFAAYTRLHFEGTDVLATDAMRLGEEFSLLRLGEGTIGKPDGFVGGVVGAWNQRITNALLFEMRVRASSVGHLAIRTDNTRGGRQTDTLLLGSNEPLSGASIDFGSVSLPVLAPEDGTANAVTSGYEDSVPIVTQDPRVTQTPIALVALTTPTRSVNGNSAEISFDSPGQRNVIAILNYHQSRTLESRSEPPANEQPENHDVGQEEEQTKGLEPIELGSDNTVDRLLLRLESLLKTSQLAKGEKTDFSPTIRRSELSRIEFLAPGVLGGKGESEQLQIKRSLAEFNEIDVRYSPSWGQRVERLFDLEQVSGVLQADQDEHSAREHAPFSYGYNRAAIGQLESVESELAFLMPGQPKYLALADSDRSRQAVSASSEELGFSPLLDRPFAGDSTSARGLGIPHSWFSLQRLTTICGWAILFGFPFLRLRRSRESRQAASVR